MASWRDQASQGAQSDLDGLLNITLEAATEQIREQGGFIPFAACVGDDGDVELLMAETGDDDASRLAAGLRAELVSRRDQVRAAAVVVDVRLPEQGRDGVRVDLEHREGAALQVVLPYSQAGGAVELGQVAASSGTARIWT